MFMRVALVIHGKDFKDAIETYNLMSEKYFIHATPTLFNAGTPEIMLAWVSTNSWDDIYFNSNKLPATRMWWWFNMKYQEDTYRWENGKYYNNNLDKIFFEDLLDESPRLAVIQEDIDSPPLFIKNYVESNYTLNKKIDGFLVYITNSKLEQ